jgi:hypothetical protein
MTRSPFQSGIESLVAEVLRVHVVDAVLDRPEVRRNLSPEALERLRADVMQRLSRSESQGMAHRVEVMAAVQGALGAAGPAGALLRTALSTAWDRLSKTPGTPGATEPADPEPAAPEPADADGPAGEAP